jgi:hypothetical protein
MLTNGRLCAARGRKIRNETSYSAILVTNNDDMAVSKNVYVPDTKIA